MCNCAKLRHALYVWGTKEVSVDGGEKVEVGGDEVTEMGSHMYSNIHCCSGAFITEI